MKDYHLLAPINDKPQHAALWSQIKYFIHSESVRSQRVCTV